MSKILLAEGAAPDTPASGKAVLYIDTNGNLRVKDDAGVIKRGGIQTEGTWTPTLVGSSTAGAHTYTTQTGRYIKSGGLVVANFRIQINAKDGAMAGTVRIGGLPFSAQVTAGLNRSGNISFWASLATAFTWMNLYVSSGDNFASVVGVTAAATSASNMVAADVQNGSRFDGVAIYETDS